MRVGEGEGEGVVMIVGEGEGLERGGEGEGVAENGGGVRLRAVLGRGGVRGVAPDPDRGVEARGEGGGSRM